MNLANPSALLWLALAVPMFAGDPAYDLVLRGGKIVDGTGNAWFYGDVGVRGLRV